MRPRSPSAIHHEAMTVDLPAARRFLATHGRLLDRRRMAAVLGDGEPDAVLAGLEAYRNPDGGYGWGLEPDLRAPESQPAGALHAFEVFDEIGPVPSSSRAAELCDWLDAVTLPDGGLPFAFSVGDPAGCASFWAEADPTVSSLHITAAVAAYALRAARHDATVAGHRWLARSTEYCTTRIAGMERAGHAIELKFVLELLDGLADRDPDVRRHIERLGTAIPPTGLVHVDGGLEDETMRPLDFAPVPDRPVRALFDPDVVARELDRLESQQDDDGGWRPDFASASPVAALEWRGYQTVWAVSVLRRNGRL
jgi:hypothetical protein